MCILCTPQLTYRSTYRLTVERRIGRHIGQVSIDIWSTYRWSVSRYVDRDVLLNISADISVKHRSICRLTLDRYVGQYVDQEGLSDCRPTCRSIGYRHSADTSLLLDCRHHLTCRLVTSAVQISLIYSPLLRGFFVYNPTCLSSVLHQLLVILHRPYPLSCQLYFVYLAVFQSSVLLDNNWISGTWRLNMKPSEIFEVDQKKDEMRITYTLTV